MASALYSPSLPFVGVPASLIQSSEPLYYVIKNVPGCGGLEVRSKYFDKFSFETNFQTDLVRLRAASNKHAVSFEKTLGPFILFETKDAADRARLFQNAFDELDVMYEKAAGELTRYADTERYKIDVQKAKMQIDSNISYGGPSALANCAGNASAVAAMQDSQQAQYNMRWHDSPFLAATSNNNIHALTGPGDTMVFSNRVLDKPPQKCDDTPRTVKQFTIINKATEEKKVDKDVLPDISLTRALKWAVVALIALALGERVWKQFGAGLTKNLESAIKGVTDKPAA